MGRPDSRTWTAAEIRAKVMDYDEGCASGRAAFLHRQFDIDANPMVTWKFQVTINVPAFTEEFEELDTSEVAAGIERVLDKCLGEELEIDSDYPIDCRHVIKVEES